MVVRLRGQKVVARGAGHRGLSENRGDGHQPATAGMEGIEATEKLAASSNAKVGIIGNPKNGLPLVLEPK